jgi:hypothetical protein
MDKIVNAWHDYHPEKEENYNDLWTIRKVIESSSLQMWKLRSDRDLMVERNLIDFNDLHPSKQNDTSDSSPLWKKIHSILLIYAKQ